MKDSRELQGKQTTSYEGYPQEVGVELRGNGGVQSNTPASQSGRNGTHGNEECLLERILHRDNLNMAYKRVKSNKGSHGIDGMEVNELLPFLKKHGETIRQSILEGSYKPKPVRRVEIPKPDGGTRQLGIPTVLDRMIQQAIAQELTKIFDPGFSEYSYGFRPNKNAHQAIIKARDYIQQGHNWVVDIDLEKFFDRVNHDKLMSLVSRKVKDKRVLHLIRKYLESGIMLNGIKVKSEEGTPQGGPLSPLLSNIMLDELDKELERRGHKFCRYADDCNIYVKSKKAGDRVMASITQFVEERLKLKVNRDKSAVDKPIRRKFLGFSFYNVKGETRNFIHKKPIERFKAKIREITSRSNGKGMEWRKIKLNQLIIGWVNYFKIADMRNLARNLDQWIRRRIRMCYWKQWKKIKTKHNNLVKLGIKDSKAWEYANTRKGYWRISGSHILSTSLTNERLEKMGFTTLTKRLSM
ncbi:group II intron reverse transcriptase/maturase [Thermotalea metallivorans]|uniref:RNA-directed DNA polymerase n=1 Tax=Thermotalea metallivorans TaxID=520762 RepID=A0A140LB36_9FIRM|nr:group II intron reverse transcriptase/maturase [Thermotalea metallivorans]KXG77761.1 Group II intron-encoded protein LtrA [Thermotalea metallivorans]